MKKLSIALLAVLTAVSAAAATKSHPQQPLTCPFTDYFFVVGSPAIVSVTGSSNLAVTPISPTEFTTGCANNNVGNGGEAYLTVSGKSGTCSLQISDGPFQQNPNVDYVSCTGGTLQFSGMGHTTGTYSYYLQFAN